MIISVITPSINSSKYIERAIQSVLHQDYDNWEHIVVDGGSTDGTIDVLKKYPHLKWISEPDRGQSDAMNKGFEMSRGDIIGYLNADDWYETGIFKKIINYFLEVDADMIVGNIKILYANGKFEIRKPSDKYNHIIKYWNNKFPPNPVCYFYKRNVQDLYGKFPVGNHMTMDLDFVFYAYRYFKIRHFEDLFGIFYIDGNNKTGKMNVLAEQKSLTKSFLRNHDFLRYLYFYFPFVNQVKLNLKKIIKRIFRFFR